MWLALAFLSATLLGFYDSFKKKSLDGNAVIPVLFLNTLFSSLIFLPFIIGSAMGHTLEGTIFHVASGGWNEHQYIMLKSLIVLSSWIFGYFGMKHLPLTIVGPINATRPVMVLVGAFIVFGERLNLYQWHHSSCSVVAARKKASTSSTTVGFISSCSPRCWGQSAVFTTNTSWLRRPVEVWDWTA